MGVQNLRKENYEEFTTEGAAVVKFFADWCGDCRAIKKPYEEIAKKLDDQGKFGEVNVEEQDQLSLDHHIKAIPTFILYKEGKELDRFEEPSAGKLKDRITAHVS